jgi:phosphosulfolactate synthase (CoM biosynthesis protein A)
VSLKNRLNKLEKRLLQGEKEQEQDFVFISNDVVKELQKELEAGKTYEDLIKEGKIEVIENKGIIEIRRA